MVLGWLRIIGRSRRDINLLHDPEHFESMLDRERSRADRSGTSFSLITIRLSPRDRNEATYRVLSRILSERLRATDLTGFMSDGRIGVLLSDTQIVGAYELRDSLRLALEEKDVAFEDEVSSYPTGDLPRPEIESRDTAIDSEQAEAKPLEPILCQRLPLWKRSLDLGAATVGLIVLLPVLLTTAILVKLTSRGSVFFAQQRAGLGGKPFVIYKFRTMCDDAEDRKAALMTKNEQDGPAFKITHDPRITPIGRILRKSCIDELPQLLNVLKGDMTIVGPRPLPCNESDQVEGWQRRRLDVTPGLTCTWQAGARRVTFAEWARLDIRYSKKRTLRNDIKLMWKTLLKVVFFRASS